MCKYTICAISWDEEKNRRNLELHGITFEAAARARPSKEWMTALITANGEGMPWDW
ncbi:MAG TPA: BrnT family toxin [Candidatus Sulfotelmatobacter sp.]